LPFLVGSGRAPSTAYVYQRDAVIYLKFLQNYDPEALAPRFDKVTLNAFIFELLEAGLKRSTIQRYMMGVLAFWEYMHDLEQAPEPRTLKNLNIRIKPRKNPSKPLTWREFDRFVKGLSDELASIL
jgi:site-specific recombinase XerD